MMSKFAVAVFASVILTVQYDVVTPVHAPAQPVNLEPVAAVAVSFTLVPLA